MYSLLGELGVTIDALLKRLPRVVLMVICLMMIVLIGAIDYFIQQDFFLFILYLIPVGLASWRLGRRFSDLAVVLSAVIWSVTYFGSRETATYSTIIWNTLFFSIMLWTISLLLTNLRVATDVEHQLLRLDPVTGAINKPYFMELLQGEYNRSQRYGYPLTFAYVELDQFESIYEKFGQDNFNSLLADIADQFGFQLRSNDIVARLDQCEFGILLPHTDSEQADIVLDRLKQDLINHPILRKERLSCRLGGMTFLSMPDATEDLISQTKHLLRSLKSDSMLKFAHEVVQ